MKNQNKIVILLISLLLITFSCNKESAQRSDLEIVRNNNNKKSYPVTKMDSAQAITFITKQKIQELLDLSTLYTAGNRDTEIDSVIFAQMKSYFVDQDSSKLSPLLLQLDSLKVQTAKVGNISVTKEIRGKDTLDLAKFYVEYFDFKNRLIGSFEKNAQYVLKPSPVKFVKEFKFYFVDFDSKLPKDSTSVGVTK
ncbi:MULTISPECIES: hypothetical protein [unclassified Kaistella]|uniref:hypothetical protein n=1 Tax=unclassified Kaistella TaxID=2762626 RepID=UPI00273262A7|nr:MULTISPECIES: hypothetical protein [unclassified Kaistella]MCZ2083637.1 hypothetical protein [Flavobacteriales bacterium]MDP2454374.1 hypothetical protein [Kaistella sp. SH11-4b]MDP2457861.1 hypothetical protein [Kaistella sp. SH40-3]MDP2460767.1 hypothetical protein [Kaistella sp. SH19-2b]